MIFSLNEILLKYFLKKFTAVLGSRCFSGPDKWKIRSSCRSHDQKVSNLLSSVFVRKSIIGCGFADFVCIFLKNPPNNRRIFSSALKCRFYHSFHTCYTCDAVWYKKENTIKYDNVQFHGTSSTLLMESIADSLAYFMA